jgi:hypothetical protein
VLARCEVRMHRDVHANFCVGPGRALVFASHIFPRAQVLWSMEPAVVQHLQEEFVRLWSEAEPYCEESTLADVPAREGRVVDVKGFASEMVEFRGQKMLKVTAGGATVGVLTSDAAVATLQGGPVRVVGKVMREGGTPYIEARRIEKAQREPIPARPR